MKTSRSSEHRLLAEGLLALTLLASATCVIAADPLAVDVFAIQHADTTSGMTEANILDGATHYGSFSFRNATPLPETNGTWHFAMSDWNRDGVPDLIAISKSNTASHATEVYVVNGAPGGGSQMPFSTLLLHAITALPETDDS